MSTFQPGSPAGHCAKSNVRIMFEKRNSHHDAGRWHQQNTLTTRQMYTPPPRNHLVDDHWACWTASWYRYPFSVSVPESPVIPSLLTESESKKPISHSHVIRCVATREARHSEAGLVFPRPLIKTSGHSIYWLGFLVPSCFKKSFQSVR